MLKHSIHGNPSSRKSWKNMYSVMSMSKINHPTPTIWNAFHVAAPGAIQRSKAESLGSLLGAGALPFTSPFKADSCPSSKTQQRHYLLGDLFPDICHQVASSELPNSLDLPCHSTPHILLKLLT